MIEVITIFIIVALALVFLAGYIRGVDTSGDIYFASPLLFGIVFIIATSVLLYRSGKSDTKKEVLSYLAYQNKVEIKLSSDAKKTSYVLKDSSLTNLVIYLNSKN